MRLFVALALCALWSCNPLAPPPEEGATAGSGCTSDLDCADGLACECGTCGAPSAADLPALCEGLDFECDETEVCITSCEIDTILAPAECSGGVEFCVDGVLASQCDCLGPQPPGTSCEDGEYVCTVDPAPIGGCYTNDCAGQPEFACVAACGTTSIVSNCVDSVMTCDQLDWFPQTDCGGCIGVAPACTAACGATVGAAFCDSVADDWSCTHILVDGGPATPADECADAGPTDAGTPVDAGPDAGPADGGSPDGGADAGPADAGPADAGPDDAGIADGGDGGDAG